MKELWIARDGHSLKLYFYDGEPEYFRADKQFICGRGGNKFAEVVDDHGIFDHVQPGKKYRVKVEEER